MKTLATTLLALVWMAAICGLAAGKEKDPPKPTGPSVPKTEINALKRAMTFYLAKGEPGSCGPGCSEWIAAEGTITSGTAERLRSFLIRNSGTKRPIYFYSPGGLAAEAVAIGRVMRERGLVAGVARTIREGREAQKDCPKPKQFNHELNARLKSTLAQCNSACVYAIVGARLREVAPDAFLGVHAAKTVLTTKLPDGMKVPPEALANFKVQNTQNLRRYLVEMGIQPALLETAEKIPHESVKFLTRAEIVRFGIDKRSLIESDWIFDDRADSRNVFKMVSIADESKDEFRDIMVRLKCMSEDFVAVAYARELGPKQGLASSLTFTAGGALFDLLHGKERPSSDSGKRFDVRSAWVSEKFFQSAATSGYIEIVEVPSAGEQSRRLFKLSTAGLAVALANLLKFCRS